MNNEELLRALEEINSLINKGENQKALNSLRNLIADNPKSKSIHINSVGFLIDIGFSLKAKDIINEGILKGEQLISSPEFEKYKDNILYNIANGHYSLYFLDYKENRVIEENIDNPNLQKVKKCLRIIIKNSKEVEKKQMTKVWTNYGNCLDSIGRCMEGIYAYDEVLKIDSTHPMAIGNKAIAMKYFADISGKYRGAIYIYSHRMLKTALNDPRLVELGGQFAIDGFNKAVTDIETRVNDKKMLEQEIHHTPVDLTAFSDFYKFYIETNIKYNLFLNSHIHEGNCRASVNDPVFISMITPTAEPDLYNNFAEYINQIKEDYAIARYLFILSQYKTDENTVISKMTTYVYPYDYSQFNIYVGFLKNSYKTAFNILDKIAIFIREYYDIDFDITRLHFTTQSFWQVKENNEWKVNPRFKESKNIGLYALYDIFLDFENKEYEQMRKIRNALVHRKLIIYHSGFAPKNDIESHERIELDDMTQHTIYLLKLTKAAIMYLINFVEIENVKKRANKKGMIIPIDVDTTQFI